MNTLTDLLAHEIKDLYSAESQLIEALPDMAEMATNEELKDALQEHLQETQHQQQRLTTICQIMGISPGNTVCEGMKGIIQEFEKVRSQNLSPELLDAAIVAAAQKVEHYEMATYSGALAFAELVELQEVAELLESSLIEEENASTTLETLATQTVYVTAVEK